MATTWIDIADSAVKIGLGAAIAGLVALLSPFVAFAKEVYVDRRQRRLRLLEESVTHLETYLNFLSARASATHDYVNGVRGGKVTDYVKQRFERLRGEIDVRGVDRDKATARLELLGSHEIADEIRRLVEDLQAKTRSLYETMPDADRLARLNEFRAALHAGRRAVLKKIGEFYAFEPELRRITKIDFDVV